MKLLWSGDPDDGPRHVVTRRAWLGLGLGAVLVVAGCGGDGPDEDEPDENENDPDENEPDENEPDENENEPDENENEEDES